MLAFFNNLDQSSFKNSFRGNPVAHYKSFQAKEFRFIAQVAPLAFEYTMNGSHEAELKVLKDLCSFIQKICCSSIKESDLILLENCSSSLIDNLRTHFPTTKDRSKLHHLLHLPGDVRRFGSSLNFDTEKYESLHRFHRESIVKSNNWNDSKAASEAEFNRQFVEVMKADLVKEALDFHDSLNVLSHHRGYEKLDFYIEDPNDKTVFLGVKPEGFFRPLKEGSTFAYWDSSGSGGIRYAIFEYGRMEEPETVICRALKVTKSHGHVLLTSGRSITILVSQIRYPIHIVHNCMKHKCQPAPDCSKIICIGNLDEYILNTHTASFK
jgi:hypothetical protein